MALWVPVALMMQWWVWGGVLPYSLVYVSIRNETPIREGLKQPSCTHAMILLLLQRLAIISLWATFFQGVDRCLTRVGLRKPYYAVHVLHNAIMVALTARDVWSSVTDVTRATDYPLNWSAILLCYGLHIYHTVAYWSTLHPDDVLHHALMIGVALPLGSVVQSGALVGMNLFFTTGLPGGINYALLFAERNGWVSRATEKAINTRVHEWIRGPGCIAHATLAATTAWSLAPTLPAQVVGTLTAALTAWNGIYFASQVLRASQAPINRPVASLADESNTGRTQRGGSRVTTSTLD